MSEGQTLTSVCICGSFRHYDDMLALRADLLAIGASCEWPVPDLRRDPKTMAAEEARSAILRHLDRMDRADSILVYNTDGYVGPSVLMEIGYAHARRKPVYALAPIQDQFVMSLVTRVVSREEFLRLVRDWSQRTSRR